MREEKAKLQPVAGPESASLGAVRLSSAADAAPDQALAERPASLPLDPPAPTLAAEEEASDRELVRLSVQGDREAYRELFKRYQSRIFGMAFELLRSREDAQDITQDAFVKAFVSLSEFKGDSSFYTWIYRIAYNLVIDLKRKVTRRGGPAAEYDEAISYDADAVTGHVQNPHSALYRKQQQTMINRALSALSDEHRATVVLREVDGLSYEEIADATGVSVGTVMSRLFYARKKLQKALREVAPDMSSGAGSGPPGRGSSGDGDAGAKSRMGLARMGRPRTLPKSSDLKRALLRAAASIGAKAADLVFFGRPQLIRNSQAPNNPALGVFSRLMAQRMLNILGSLFVFRANVEQQELVISVG